ncbi:glycine cleavage system protein GcvH [Kitasatospora viridis]|uniref:Glycine cleavage system H protein n=1 Tax=Kitasatospora viridis TaxID=281105 RepID=A0A561UN42_9ACTN|nr:glycine cleavage system protein GcvH [Kitasatospora viridis]TWG00772.1 glycine cleavage system H protein [Kitasatospora viridis]
MAYPKDYKYTKEHEWVSVQGKKAKVGVTEYAARQLGDVVFVELPNVGSALDTGQSISAIESVKAASELYSPVSGKVSAVNEELNDEPELINDDAHSAWIVEIELKDPKQLDSLLTAAQYEAYISEEG